MGKNKKCSQCYFKAYCQGQGKSFFLKLGRKSSDPNQRLKEYWSALNRLINKKKTFNIPPLLEDGLFLTSVKEKANVLNDCFVEQCCAVSTGSTFPNFLPPCNVRLQSLVIDREKDLRLIRSFYNGKAHGCDDRSI